MAYEKCIDVSEEIWKEFGDRKPGNNRSHRRSLSGGGYHLPFLDRTLLLFPARRQVQVAGAPEAEPGFRLCLTALMYLLHLNPAALGPGISPLELPGGATFFRGHHGLPGGPLEERFGRDGAGFWPPGKNCTARSGLPAMPRWRWKSFPAWWWKSFYGRRTMSSPPRFRLPCRPTWTGSGSWMRSGAC